MQESLKFYNFQENQILASIGAGGGIWEIGFASQINNLTFYLQDIDPRLINNEEIQKAIYYWEKLTKKEIKGTFIPIIGTQFSTNLPQKEFDKILIINSLHELEYPEILLKEINELLKKEGEILLEETIAKQKGEIHEGCKKELFTHQRLEDFFKKENFYCSKKIKKAEETYLFCFKKYENSIS